MASSRKVSMMFFQLKTDDLTNNKAKYRGVLMINHESKISYNRRNVDRFEKAPPTYQHRQ